MSKSDEQNSISKAVSFLAGDSLVYMIGSAMIGLGNFILIPLYTRYLLPGEFGVFVLVEIAIVLLTTLTQLGLNTAYLKWYADTREYRREQLLGSALGTVIITGIAGGGLLWLTVVSSASRGWLSISTMEFAWTFLPIVILENINGPLLSDLRARRNAFAFSSSMVVRLLAIVGASLWLIAGKGMGIYGIFLGRLVGDAVGVAILLLLTITHNLPRFTLAIAIPMIRFGFPLALGVLMATLADAIGRSLLNHFSTVEQVGYYGVAVKISGIYNMLIVIPFGVAWGGLMFQVAKWPDARIIFSKIYSYALLLSLFAAMVIALFTPILFTIFSTEEYRRGMVVFPMIILVRALGVMMFPASIGLYLSGKTRWIAVIYFLGLIVDVVVSIILIPRYGMIGAAWGWIAFWVTIIVVLTKIGQRYYPLQLDWSLIAVPTVAWVAILATGLDKLAPQALASHWTLQFGFIVLIIFSLYLLLLRHFPMSGKK